MRFNPEILAKKLADRAWTPFHLVNAVWNAHKERLSEETVKAWLSGRSTPRSDNLVAVANVLGCKVEDFFFIEDSDG